MRRNPIILSLGIATACGLASGQATFEMIGDDLSRQTVQVLSIDSESITWVSDAGEVRSAPADTVLGLESIQQEDGAPQAVFGVLTYEPSILRLVDGRRLTGALSGEAGIEETLRWQHPVLGKMDVPLELIDRLTFQSTSFSRGTAPVIAPADDADVIVLRNGDRLEGFVVALDRDAVIEVENREIRIPMESVHQLALANPREHWDGPMLWLNDGSVIGAAGVTFDGREFLIHLAGTPTTEADDEAGTEEVRVRAENVRSVNMDTGSLVPLRSLMDSAAPGVSIVESRSTFDAAPISMNGDSSFELSLPHGASQLTLTATLPLRARSWGRFDIILSTDGIVRSRLPLSASQPHVDYSLDLQGSSQLSITLESGDFGRVHAHAEIRGALISID